MQTYEEMELYCEDEDNEFLAGRIFQKIADEDLDSRRYMVCDDDNAEALVKDYIRESLWAFNADFLASETGLPVAVFKALQPQCEGANEAIEDMIEQTCGLDSFVEDAVSADGRGHFLSSYNGEENEVEVDGITYYVYAN